MRSAALERPSRPRGRRLAALLAGSVLLGCAKSTEEWSRELQDPDPFVRELAAAALGESPPAEAGRAFTALLPLADATPPQVRTRVRASLAKLAAPALLDWLAAEPLTQVRPSVLALLTPALQRQGAAAAPGLAVRLEGPDGSEPATVGRLLWACGEPGQRALRRTLQASQPKARARAAQAARALGHAGAPLLPDLVPLLADPEPEVRVRAARALLAIDPRGGLGLPEALAAAEGPDPALRAALRPLAIRSEARRLSLLPEEQVPASLARLEEFLPEAVDVLADDLASPREQRALVALNALRALAKSGPPAPEAQLGELRRALALDPPPGRVRAAFALARLGPKALPALGEIEKALGDREDAVRALAALALARLGGASAPARSTLEFTLHHERNPAVQRAMTQALRAMRG